jgi:asparagine synthase (glutamine-hydrolysing)
VLYLKDDVWVVADRVVGAGRHSARLHWLAGPFDSQHDVAESTLRLSTPAGPFSVAVVDEHGNGLASDVVTGQEQPPRGWLSRYYGEKTGVPSLAAVRTGEAPLTFVSILAGRDVTRSVAGGNWTLSASQWSAKFRLTDGDIRNVEVWS